MPTPIDRSSSTSGAGEPTAPIGGEQARNRRGEYRQAEPSAQLRGLAPRTRREACDEAGTMSELLGVLFEGQSPSPSAEPRHTQRAEALRLNTLASALPALRRALRPAVAKHLLREILQLDPEHGGGPLGELLAAGLIDAPATKIDEVLDTLSELPSADQTIVLGAIASASAMRKALRETDGPASLDDSAPQPALSELVETVFDGARDKQISKRRRVAAPETQRLIDDLLDRSAKYDVEHLRRQAAPQLGRAAAVEPIVDAMPRLDIQDQHALLNILVPHFFEVIGPRKIVDLIGIAVDIIPRREDEGSNRLLADLVGNDVRVFELVKHGDRWPLARRVYHLVMKEQPENPELICAFFENVAVLLPPSGRIDFWHRIKEFANESTAQYRDIVVPFVDRVNARSVDRRFRGARP